MKPTARPFGVPETVQVVAADRIARLLVTAFGLCEECGVPLGERQKIALLTTALLEFDGLQAEVEGLRRVERLLEELRDSNGRATYFDEND